MANLFQSSRRLSIHLLFIKGTFLRIDRDVTRVARPADGFVFVQKYGANQNSFRMTVHKRRYLLLAHVRVTSHYVQTRFANVRSTHRYVQVASVNLRITPPMCELHLIIFGLDLTMRGLPLTMCDIRSSMFEMLLGMYGLYLGR